MDTNVLHNLSYGMYLVASYKAGALNGQIANSAMQVTSQPATIAVSINKANLTHEFIRSSRRFSLSILAEETPFVFIGRFGFKSGRTEDKFKGIQYLIRDSGCPVVLDHALGWFEAAVVGELDCTTHTVFLGEVIDSALVGPGKPMTYAYYHQVKRGLTPQSAPTFIKEEP